MATCHSTGDPPAFLLSKPVPQSLPTATSGNALMLAEGSTLGADDLELILRALDVLDRLTQDELASKGQDAELIGTRSRLLIARAKVSAMSGVAMSAADHDHNVDVQALEEYLDRQLDLRRTLHGVQQTLEQAESFVSVATFALRAQAADIDRGVAVVLDAAANALQEAGQRLATATLGGAEKINLREALAAIRDRLLLDAGEQGGAV